MKTLQRAIYIFFFWQIFWGGPSVSVLQTHQPKTDGSCIERVMSGTQAGRKRSETHQHDDGFAFSLDVSISFNISPFNYTVSQPGVRAPLVLLRVTAGGQ